MEETKTLTVRELLGVLNDIMDKDKPVRVYSAHSGETLNISSLFNYEGTLHPDDDGALHVLINTSEVFERHL